MTAYDVQVESPSGKSGETIRVEAANRDEASEAALELVPAGWSVARVSDATDHGEAWGVDTTQGAVAGPVIETAEEVGPLDWEPTETDDEHPGVAVTTEVPEPNPPAE